jgi:HEAT repeat protein
MADRTLKRLAEIISESPRPELRRAAIVVAGEVADGREPSLVKALVAAADAAEAEVSLPALNAIGKLRAESALPKLITLVEAGGPAVEAAARAAGGMGARGARAMEKIMARAHPVLRRRIASALAHSGTESAAVATAHALLDEDSGVVEAAAKSLAGEVPTLSDGQRRALANYLISCLQQKRKPPLPGASVAAMVRVLSVLHHPKAEELFWKCLNPARAVPVRAAALQALGTLPLPKSDGKLARLFMCALEPEFQIAAPAMMLLKQIPASRKSLKTWHKLLAAPDVAVRRFAVERLKDFDDPTVAKGLAAQLQHPDRSLRDDAFNALSRTARGRLALLDALLTTESPDQCWQLARAEARFAGEWPISVRPKLFAQACRYRDADDRRADPLFFLLREIDADWTHAQILARGLERRRKKDFASAVGYLKLLARDPACGEETRFELACTGLKTSNRDLAPEARSADPTIAQFSRLLGNPQFDMLARLKKVKWLDPEDLFYLGFHFVEQKGREQQFGADVLKLLIQRSARSQLAKDAKMKLKSEGLA